nr:Phenylacetic acid degradation protein paaC [Klebsiella pneumoniae]
MRTCSRARDRSCAGQHRPRPARPGAQFLSYAAELNGCGDEDTLAFGRDERRFSNLLLVEQPNGNFADTIARQFFIDVWHVALFSRLVNSRDAQLAAIAAKGLKEVRYHQRFSRGWLERLGNGTELSNRKMQQAVDNLWRFTGELFLADEVELSPVEQGIAVDPRELQAEWQSAVHTALLDSGLQIPQEAAFRSGGKQGCTVNISARCWRRCSICSVRIPDCSGK